MLKDPDGIRGELPALEQSKAGLLKEELELEKKLKYGPCCTHTRTCTVVHILGAEREGGRGRGIRARNNQEGHVGRVQRFLGISS